MSDNASIYDAIAFLMVECGMSYEEALDVDITGPLYASLHRTVKNKIDRQDAWFAQLGAITANPNRAEIDPEKLLLFSDKKEEKKELTSAEFSRMLGI